MTSTAKAEQGVTSESQAIKNPMRFWWWVRSLLGLIVKAKVDFQSNSSTAVESSKDKPTLYVINRRSFADILVLYSECKRLNLPLPVYDIGSIYRKPGRGAYLYMKKLGLFQPQSSQQTTTPKSLSDLVRKCQEEKNDVNVIPVGFYWGRNPGKEGSLLKLLFFDHQNTGLLQKLIIILLQGRNLRVVFGDPQSLKQNIQPDISVDQNSKRLRRIFRLYFNKLRGTYLGPSLYNRAQVQSWILRSTPIKKLITKMSAGNSSSAKKLQKKAAAYSNEISAEIHYSVVRFFEILLTGLFKKLYKEIIIENHDQIKKLALDHELVYLPNHRSHMDYLLTNYFIHHLGYNKPHTAAGNNLNFWPIGPLVRRAGAFFLRRKISGNALYAAVFNEYVHYLISKNHPIQFYIEGGRSRTGIMLTPKTGMLSMMLSSHSRLKDKKIALLPINVTYDKIAEMKAYVKELAGRSKKSESMWQFWKARKILFMNLGNIYIKFGEPIILDKFVDSKHPDWRSESTQDESRPGWVSKVSPLLGEKVLSEINRHCYITPTSLMALILHSIPNHAIDEAELHAVIKSFIYLFDRSDLAKTCEIVMRDPETIIKRSMQLSPRSISRIEHPGGNLIVLNDDNYKYYKNTIIHTMLSPSLIASFYSHYDSHPEDQLIRYCELLMPFINSELYLEMPSPKEDIVNALESMISYGLLERKDGNILRCDVMDAKFHILKVYGMLLRHTFERYSIAGAVLSKVDFGIEEDTLVKQCRSISERISILNGIVTPQKETNTFYESYFHLLKKQGFINEEGEGKYKLSGDARTLAQGCLNLLSPDLRQSLDKTFRRSFSNIENTK